MPPTDPQAELTLALAAHNQARLKLSLDPLEWSPTLASNAQGYADHIANINKAEYGDTQGQGENIFWLAGDTDFVTAVNRWLAEKPVYHGQVYGEGDIQGYGGFTQCVWAKTTHVGMAKAKSKEGVTYVVARYMPPGNVKGETPY